MFNDILLSVGVSLGYFFGLVLYQWVREEIDPVRNDFKILRKSIFYLAALYGLFLALSLKTGAKEIVALILFGAAILQSALISARLKMKTKINLAAKQAVILVVVFIVLSWVLSIFI